jgi:Ca-activated chloride channel family protein
MTFAHPKLIILLVIPVTLLFWEWVRRGQPLVMPFDEVHKRSGWLLGGLVLIANCLPAVLLAFAIILLARPLTFAPPKTERQLSNIQIVLDTSPSMGSRYGVQTGDKAYTRFDGAMDAIDKFLTARQGDACGLTIFSRGFIHWVPLTQDTAAIRMARPFIAPQNFPDPIWGGTFIAKALDGAITPLTQRPAGDRMIILVTDGESWDIRRGAEREIISKLRRNKIVVFAISMLENEIEPGLEAIARETGGQTFRALTPEALRIVFDRIDQMQKVQVRTTKPEVIDFLDPFLPWALAALALQVAVLFGLRFTPW